MLSFPGNDFHVNCLRSSSGHQLGESALLNKTSLNVLAPDFSRPCCQTRPSQQKLAIDEPAALGHSPSLMMMVSMVSMLLMNTCLAF